VAARHSIVALVVGTIIATALVASSYSAHVAGPAAVKFDGVTLQILYLGGSPQTFGPAHQNACNETFPTGPDWPSFGPECPGELVTGDSYDLQFFVTGDSGSSPGLWTNMTVSGPFEFEVNPQSQGTIPTSYSSTTGLYEGGQNQLYSAGEWSGWALVFTLPTTFTAPPAGLWLNASLTVQPTNQTCQICT
jgi:hypothetical protein